MNIEEAEQSRGLWRIKCSHVMIIVISVLSLVSLPSLPKPKGLEYKHRHQLILLYLLYFSLTYLTHYSDFCLSFLNTHCFVNLTHISLMQFVSLLPHVEGGGTHRGPTDHSMLVATHTALAGSLMFFRSIIPSTEK